MSALDELLNRWRKRPEAGATIALCSHLGVSQRKDLIHEVGSAAQQRYSGDGEVMLAVGRMYLDVAMFPEAQAALVQAGKANANNGQPFRFLGEVLLRRGDAARALKVFERARQLGVVDAGLDRWQDRALVYCALQKRVGTEAVAREVEKNEPLRPSLPPQAPFDLDELSVQEDAPQSLSPRPPPSAATPRVRRPLAPLGAVPPAPKLVRQRDPGLPPPPLGGGVAAVARRQQEPSPRQELYTDEIEELEVEPEASPAVTAAGASVTDETTQPRIESSSPPREQLESGPLPSFDHSQAEWIIEPPTVPGNAFYPSSIPGLSEDPATRGSVDHGRGESDRRVPEAALVLEHLARVGLFEPQGAVTPAWEQAPKRRTRGSWVLILATVLVAAGGGAGYYYAAQVKAERLAHADALNREVAGLLLSGTLDNVRSTDDKLRQSFELDSLSQQAARLWLENRMLHTLLAPGESRGLDSATHRAKRVGMDEADYAFGKVAGFLAEGDVAGAAALLPKWDKRAGKDPYYQLAAGAVLERAGDLRAIERYEAARALDEKLLVADMLLARLALLELAPEKGQSIIEALKKKGGDAASVQALEALHWAVDPDRPKEVPAAAKIDKAAEGSLSVPLRPVVYAVEALQAIEAADYKEASRAISAGVERSLSPAMATRLGFLAIQAGDEKLARKAALRALGFSAVYPGARVLAARVALLGGRLEEAQKAIEQLDPDSKDVAIVRAVVAYETLDGSALDAAVEAFGDNKDRPELEALSATPQLLNGVAYPDEEVLSRVAHPQVPWGQVVAVDAALAQGNLELAQRLVQSWPTDTLRPVYSLRLSRLARYQGKLDAALKYSEQALSTPTFPAVVERVLVLLDNEQPRQARELVAKYPALLGSAKNWLGILIDAAQGRDKQATASASALEFPPEGTPLLLRLLAARAFAVAHDKRAKDFVTLMQRQAKGHPEALALKKLL